MVCTFPKQEQIPIFGKLHFTPRKLQHIPEDRDGHHCCGRSPPRLLFLLGPTHLPSTSFLGILFHYAHRFFHGVGGESKANQSVCCLLVSAGNRWEAEEVAPNGFLKSKLRHDLCMTSPFAVLPTPNAETCVSLPIYRRFFCTRSTSFPAPNSYSFFSA